MRYDNEEGVQLRQRVSGVGHIVAGGDVNFGRAAPPPPGHPQAIACPQCHGTTWRHTRLCVACDFDIGLWTAQREEEFQRLRRQARMRKLGGRFALCSAGAAGVAFTNFFQGFDQLFVCGLAFVFGLGAVKAWEGSSR